MLEHDVLSPDSGPLLRTLQEEREFAAALRLREWVRALLDGPARREWHMAPGVLDNIFISTFAKGTKTFRAAVLMCDRGYGLQAAMLNRSLFEHALVSWWMFLCVDDEAAAMEAVRAHHEHSRLMFARAAERYPHAYGGKTIRTVDAETAATLDKRFGKYGAKPWHLRSLDALVREVEDAAEAIDQGQFRMLFHVVNKQNNYMLHHSPLGLMDTVEWRDAEEVPIVRTGPSNSGRRESLWAATRIYGLLADATLRRLSPGRVEEFSGVFDDVMLDLNPLTAEQVAGVGRNDPCPCGIGAKFKRCHGPRML